MPEALVITDQSYAGTVASTMITRAVIGPDTVQKGCVYIQDGIKKSHTIPRIEVTGFMQKRQPTPITKGTITVDGRVLTPLDMMLYMEFNPRDYESHWFAEQLSPTLLARDLPQTPEAFMVMQTMARLGEYFENAYWRSRTAYDLSGTATDPTSKGAAAGDAQYFYFDGLLKKLLDAATVPPVGQRTILVGTPATLVSGTAGGGEENIIAALKRCLDLVPDALLFKYGSSGLRFLVNYKTQKVYEEALALSTYKNQDNTEKGINRYKGYDVVPLAGLTDDTIVVCYAQPTLQGNLWVGVNSVDDNTLQMAKLQANSELYFLKGLFKMDTQVGFPEQIVLYTKLTA